MADTHHLVRRNDVWYFRRRVPKELVAALGKTYIQHSLDTSDKKVAKQRREIEDVKWSAQFDALSAAQADAPPASPVAPISKLELVELVRRYVDEMDARFSSRYADEAPETGQEKQEVLADIELGIQMLEDPDDPRGRERVFAVGQRLMGGEPGAGNDGLPFAAFSELVRRALLELDRRKLARVQDDHRDEFFDALFNPDRPPSPTFGELADQFLEWRLGEATANKVGQKFVEKITACVALIREIVGADTPVTAVDFDMCQHVRAVVARTPANRVKIYGDLPLVKVIDRAASDGRPLMSPITQQAYLRALTDVLSLAVKKRLIPSNPADGLGPLKRDTVAPENKRLSFEPCQLIEFFHSEFYRKCAASGPEPFNHDKDGWRFWLPLISLFTGARPNEICQLALDDIRQTDQGTWYFDHVLLSDDDATDPAHREPSAKRLKTHTSRRKIPVHPQLIRLGLLRYVDHQRASRASRLFPSLKPDASGYPSAYPLKRFRETFLPKAMTLKGRQSFYSFRHTFRDALRAIEAPPDTLQALGAWSQGTRVSDNYGTRANPDIQRKWVDRIEFPGLNLDHLWIKN